MRAVEYCFTRDLSLLLSFWVSFLKPSRSFRNCGGTGSLTATKKALAHKWNVTFLKASGNLPGILVEVFGHLRS